MGDGINPPGSDGGIPTNYIIARRSPGCRQFESIYNEDQRAIEITAMSGQQHLLILFGEDGNVQISRRDPHPSYDAPRWFLYEVGESVFWESYHETPGRHALPKVLGVIEKCHTEDDQPSIVCSIGEVKAAMGWPDD